MTPVVRSFVGLGRALLMERSRLALENLALRQQLAVYHRSIARPVIRMDDRIFWALLSRMWEGWRDSLIFVKPQTVIRWHRLGFRLYWRWKCRGAEPGRPPIGMEVILLIRRMSQENSTWGAPRIQAELHLLGFDVSESTVAKYMIARGRRPPSQTWRTFLDNHINQIAACDFFVVPTATFHLLWCFVILSHDRRRIVHFNVTDGPSAGWTAQQVIEAFPGDGPAPRYLLRDRDQIYGARFRSRMKGMGIDEVITAYRSPWQNPYAERVIGTIRRECTDHLIVLGESHLRRLMKQYVRYYNESRPHSSLGHNSPIPRQVESPERGCVAAEPILGGLHHRYRRVA
jgi:transposase InsO family protein